MTSWDQRELVEDAVARGVSDWLHVADLASVAKRAGVVDPRAIRLLAIGILAQMLCSGLCVAGDADELGFHPWDLSNRDALDRVIDTWQEDDPYPTPGSVAWISLTEKGKEIGRSVLAREP